MEKLPFRTLSFDLLAAQSRFKEAFAAAGRPVTVEDDGDGLDLKQARWLYLLGETDQAVQTFTRKAGALKQAGQVSEAAELVKTELRLGLDLTGFFLERHVFWPHNKPLPAARARFMETLQRQEQQ